MRYLLLSLAVFTASVGALPAVAQGTIDFRGARPQPVTPPVVVPPVAVAPTPDPAVARLQARTDELEALLQRLTGQVESLQFEVRQLRDTNSQLRNRIDTMEARRAEERLAASGLGGDTAPTLPEGLQSKPLPDTSSPSLPPVAGPAPPVSRPAQPGVSAPVVVPPTGARQPGTPVGAPSGSLGQLPASALPGEAGALFNEAKARLARGDYPGAEQAFRQFLASFGEDASVPEAHHWLGDALRVQRAYGEAAEAYRQAVLVAPQGPFAAESLAKLVTTLRLMNDVERACTLVGQFRRQFPNPSFTARQRVDTEMSLLRCPA